MLGAGGVPASAVAAVALNVTLTEASAPGYVQVIPSDGRTALGSSSNLNASHADQTVANVVIVPVGADGSVTLYTQSGAHLVVDVSGYYTDAAAPPSVSGLFVPSTPTRLLDTRLVPGAPVASAGAILVEPGGPAGAGTGIDITHAAAIVTNLTATEASGPGYVQAVPTGRAAFGSSSSLNVEEAGQTIANAAQITLGDNHNASLFAQTSTHLICDMSGWYTI
jgi:hypothetical protein